MLSPLPLGPEELRRIDLQMARQDPRHRCKQIEERVRAWWFGFTKGIAKRWTLRGERKAAKRKGLTEAERVARRENVGLQRREK